jgi:hypothetical protein
MRALFIALSIPLAFCAILGAQSPEYTIAFREPTTEVANIQLPIEAAPRIQFAATGMMGLGLKIDEKKWLCCYDGAIRTTFKIDNAIVFPNNVGNVAKLAPDRLGRPRHGVQSTFVVGNVHITQILEVIPSKAPPGQRTRPLDNALIRYVIENKDQKPRTIGMRVRIDTMCNQNDGALFAAPTRPGEVLDGIELSGKTLPEYVQILEVPNLKAPGFTGHFTLKMTANRIGPDRFQCTSHRINDNGWDSQPAPAGGDSDCVMFWSPRVVPAGQKIEMAYAYGQGIASLTDGDSRLKISLGGNFEPGKLFTVQAFVEEPALGETVALELPDGMTLVEGSPLQPVAPADGRQATAVALWKGRVERAGDFVLRIRSTNGVTESRTVSVTRAGG